MELKFCKDCKHYQAPSNCFSSSPEGKRAFQDGAVCLKFPMHKVNYVDGTFTTSYHSCEWWRNPDFGAFTMNGTRYSGTCGVDGKYWEHVKVKEKEGVFKQLKNIAMNFIGKGECK